MNGYNVLLPTLAFEFKKGWKEIKKDEETFKKKKEKEKKRDKEILEKLIVDMVLAGAATLAFWSFLISWDIIPRI